ncbi:hypothetical protein [Endozoicomonas numazuensis]|uniref:hypothetical protein n=1 Tax=Endozoicomonas numazuensis TaxID=1137799 RepID=UPI001F2B719E|nr:hypothetical protein [Endozoicomonas numazuensis]
MTVKAYERQCDKDVIDIPKDHWLFTESKDTQRNALLYLNLNNGYECDRESLKEELYKQVENAGRTGDNQPLEQAIELTASIVSDNEEQRRKVISLIGIEKLEKLTHELPDSFNIFSTFEYYDLVVQPTEHTQKTKD